jgi:hypothetical protein
MGTRHLYWIPVSHIPKLAGTVAGSIHTMRQYEQKGTLPLSVGEKYCQIIQLLALVVTVCTEHCSPYKRKAELSQRSHSFSFYLNYVIYVSEQATF